MYRKIVDIISKETLRLINEQQNEIFLPLLQTADLFLKQDIQRNLSEQLINYWVNVMKDEAYKVKHMEVTFVVIGTMKSGKSTTINAIVGDELLPNRNQPMTILPTIIRHCPHKLEPELVFANPEPFNELIETLHHKLKDMESNKELEHFSIYTTSDGRELIEKILGGSMGKVRQKYQGRKEIFAFLSYINDIWRLCSNNTTAIDTDKYLQQYHKLQDLPVIETEFFHLRDQDFQGRFALVDTPGPNEAGQIFLKNIMADQLQKASAVILILDYTQMNAEAEAEIRKSLKTISQGIRSNLFVLINKFDQKDRNDMNVENLRAYVAQLFEEGIKEERVFPISSKYAYLANRALRELSHKGHLANYAANPWIEDFGQLALGACWEREIGDLTEVERRADKLWEYSQFEYPLAGVIKNGCENAALTSLKSAIAKMLDYDKKIIESIRLRISALSVDVKIIEHQISAIQEDLGVIKTVQNDLQAIIQNSTDTLYRKFDSLVDKNIVLLKEEVKFKISLNIYEDFSNEEDARIFLGKLSEIATRYFQYIQQEAKKDVDNVLENIRVKVSEKLESVLMSADERLSEVFGVTLDVPRPKIIAKFDSDRIFYSSIKKENVTKIGTILERRWYTLWSHEHKRQYHYKMPVYRIYTNDVQEILQKTLIKDSGGIWQLLDKYVQTEFIGAINTFLTDGFNYLERMKGDLLESRHDQELKSERLSELQKVMCTIHKTATNHCKDVELLGRGLLIKGHREDAV